MPKHASIEIARNTKGSVLYLVIGLVVLGLGLVILLEPGPFTPSHLYPASATFIVQAVGLSIMISAGIYCYILAARMATVFPAMVISDEDIYNHTGSPGDGLIDWNDIEDIKETDIKGRHYLSIMVKHPQTYIERQRNIAKRQTLVRLNNSYGSPIQIAASRMDYNFENLRLLLKERLEELRAAR